MMRWLGERTGQDSQGFPFCFFRQVTVTPHDDLLFLHVKNRFRASGEAVSSFIPEAAREHIRMRGETCLVGRLVLEVRN